MSFFHRLHQRETRRILNAASASRAQLSHLLALPADTHEIQSPLLILLFEELNREWLGPRLDHVARLGDHLVERLEGHAVVGDTLPLVVHVDVQLRAFKELESIQC